MVISSDVTHIPHYADKKTYAQILTGVEPVRMAISDDVEVAALEDQPKRRRVDASDPELQDILVNVDVDVGDVDLEEALSEVMEDDLVQERRGMPELPWTSRANFRWGTFTFTSKKATRASPHGGWQVLCPYHAKTEQTACTKYCALRDRSDEAEERALATLKRWAFTARTYKYAWQHSDEPSIQDDAASLDIALPAAYETLPDGFVLRTDLEVSCLPRR